MVKKKNSLTLFCRLNPYKPRLNEVLARAMKLTYVIRHTLSVLNQYFNL